MTITGKTAILTNDIWLLLKEDNTLAALATGGVFKANADHTAKYPGVVITQMMGGYDQKTLGRGNRIGSVYHYLIQSYTKDSQTLADEIMDRVDVLLYDWAGANEDVRYCERESHGGGMPDYGDSVTERSQSAIFEVWLRL